VRRRTFLLSLLGLAGCRSQQTSRDDFAQFFVSEVHGRGGRTLPVNRLPVIECRWTIERDEFGFQIHVFDAEFEAIDSFMSQVLGEPKISGPEDLDGNPHRMYDTKISSMHIQLVGKKSEVYIVAVGPKKGLHNKNGAANAGFRCGLQGSSWSQHG
jgi:hypothetical protein